MLRAITACCVRLPRAARHRVLRAPPERQARQLLSGGRGRGRGRGGGGGGGGLLSRGHGYSGVLIRGRGYSGGRGQRGRGRGE